MIQSELLGTIGLPEMRPALGDEAQRPALTVDYRYTRRVTRQQRRHATDWRDPRVG